MKKQILSAVLLTAMVGVSVAEASFTDDLRAKYTLQNGLTIRCTLMETPQKLKMQFGKKANESDPRMHRVDCGLKGDKEYQTIQHPLYESGRIKPKIGFGFPFAKKTGGMPPRSLAKYGTYLECKKQGGVVFYEVYDAQVIKNGWTYNICYDDETGKSVSVKEKKYYDSGIGFLPMSIVRIFLTGETGGQKLTTEECGKEKVFGEDYNVEKLKYSFTYKNKTYNYFYKVFYDDKGVLMYFTARMDEKMDAKDPLGFSHYFKVDSMEPSFDDATYNKLNKYCEDFVANKKKEE